MDDPDNAPMLGDMLSEYLTDVNHYTHGKNFKAKPGDKVINDDGDDGEDDYLKAFPSGTNYGTYEKEDGSSVSITGDTFRSLHKRFASGVIRTSNNVYRLQKQGYWQDKDGKRYGGTKMLEMFQPPKGPSLLSSTDFAGFKGDMKGGGVTKRNQTPIMLDTSLKIDE